MWPLTNPFQVPADSVEPSFRGAISQLCTQAQFETPEYRAWCAQIRETPRYHRKQWEYCFILQVLDEAGMLCAGQTGIGFGVGREPLVAVMASRGCSIVATDQDTQNAATSGWKQHAGELDHLNQRGICPDDLFRERVQHRVIDMNSLPRDIGGFDFTWSSCALEHLGTLDRGIDFIRNSLALLRPGGLAVHTTEFNLSSNWVTRTSGKTVLYRRRDIEEVAADLREKGNRIDINFHPGMGPLDHFIDRPPYLNDHLKLRSRLLKSRGLKRLFVFLPHFWVMTSLGLVITKATSNNKP